MTRIIYWNIRDFSMPKIQVANPPAAAAAATERLNFMVRQIMRGPVGGPIPDIIVVVEVYSRIREVGTEGTVLNPNRNAGRAVIRLLAQLRADPQIGTAAMGTNWCVVPPLNLGEFGQREAVAVYYNAATLQFTGPNLWYQLYGPPGPIVGQSQPVSAATHAAMINYPIAWRATLPAGAGPPRTTNFPIGAGGAPVAIPETQLAGEWQYYDPASPLPRPIPSPPPPGDHPPGRIHFPYEQSRGPFLTRFREVAAPNRTINLFAVHTSPSSARQALLEMQRVPQMNAVGAGEVNVIVGDFNVDTFSGLPPGGGLGNAYNWMLPPGGIYTCELDPRVGHAGAVQPARKPYMATHLLPTPNATPYNNVGAGVPTDSQHNVYPRYGYMGSAWPVINHPSDSAAIDNIFTAYGAGAGGPATNITVINRITGTPYNFINPPPAGVTAELTGGVNYPSLLAPPAWILNGIYANAAVGGIDSIPAPPPPPPAPPPPLPTAITTMFQMPGNYGLIYSVSDHLPLLVDI